MSTPQPYRLIISGGGTGGHIFPAIAIANVFKQRHPGAEILFVGAKGRMEMTKVPEAGYKIIGLWIAGLQRKFSLSNFTFPFKLVASYFKARAIVKKFKPHAVVGTGGYASGPIMLAATKFKIPSLIQEQNSYAGLTNKQVGGKVNRICVAYPGMERYFPKGKILLTGNPVRPDIIGVAAKRGKAMNFFAFNNNEKVILIIGGSLGARTINQSILHQVDKLIEAQIQVIWQTGKLYYEQIKNQLSAKDLKRFRIYDFIKQMDLAYAASDVVISRAGALAVSELCVAGKPVILVPSPNVAEDHQTKNAMALVERDAAVMLPDKEAMNRLVLEALKLTYDDARCTQLSMNIAAMAKPQATDQIVNEIEKLVE